MSDRNSALRGLEISETFSETAEAEYAPLDYQEGSLGYTWGDTPGGKPRKDPTVARLEHRRRNERWAAKQEPMTLKAIQVHANRAYAAKQLAKDPEWRKKRYRKYRTRILPNARQAAKAYYAAKSRDPEWMARRRARERERRRARRAALVQAEPKK